MQRTEKLTQEELIGDISIESGRIYALALAADCLLASLRPLSRGTSEETALPELVEMIVELSNSVTKNVRALEV